jgi:hypothetical protein
VTECVSFRDLAGHLQTVDRFPPVQNQPDIFYHDRVRAAKYLWKPTARFALKTVFGGAMVMRLFGGQL